MLKRIRKFERLALVFALAVGFAGCEDDPVGPEDLTAPTGLQATSSGTAVQLQWTAVSNASGYTVQRAEYGTGADYAAVATGVAATQYTDAQVAPGKTYRYRVVATAGTAASEASAATAVRVCAQGVLCGTIPTGDTVRVSGSMLMQGQVTVDSGAVIEIAAGTTIRGDVNVKPTALLVRRGGKIMAQGTASQPIVFTSSKPAGQRDRGDWGGILIAGRAPCNFPQQPNCEAEGIPTTYGGTATDDNSGRLSYVRIEFAGFEVAPGNELNGLTLYGVGSGTQIDHVQVHYGADDGIELFGGNVDIKYALVTGADDDSFDYSTGWRGRGQFWIAQQAEGKGDKGFEVDNNQFDANATPLTDARVYNVTLVGRGGTSGSNDGIQLRLGVRGMVANAIVMNFGGSAVDIDNAETAAHCTGGTVLLNNFIAFGNAGGLFENDDNLQAQCVGSDARTVSPQLVDPMNRTAPDFRPAAGSPALTGAAAVPTGGFFENAPYLGAVAPTGTPWYQGWTTFAAS